jgi:hypothetical protein
MSLTHPSNYQNRPSFISERTSSLLRWNIQPSLCTLRAPSALIAIHVVRDWKPTEWFPTQRSYEAVVGSKVLRIAGANTKDLYSLDFFCQSLLEGGFWRTWRGFVGNQIYTSNPNHIDSLSTWSRNESMNWCRFSPSRFPSFVRNIPWSFRSLLW